MTPDSSRSTGYQTEIGIGERPLVACSVPARLGHLRQIELDIPTEIVPREVEDEVVDEVVATLNEMQAQSTLDLSIRTGRLIMERFYRGDLSRWRHQGVKEISFRKLADRCQQDLRVSASYLYRAAALYELVARLGFKWETRLSTTHLRAVLGLPGTKQAALLEEAQQSAWSTARLEEEAARVRATLERRSGRPPTPPLLRMLKAVSAAWCKLESAADTDDVNALSANDVHNASNTIAELSERMDRLARRLVHGERESQLSSTAR